MRGAPEQLTSPMHEAREDEPWGSPLSRRDRLPSWSHHELVASNRWRSLSGSERHQSDASDDQPCRVEVGKEVFHSIGNSDHEEDDPYDRADPPEPVLFFHRVPLGNMVAKSERRRRSASTPLSNAKRRQRRLHTRGARPGPSQLTGTATVFSGRGGRVVEGSGLENGTESLGFQLLR